MSTFEFYAPTTSETHAIDAEDFDSALADLTYYLEAVRVEYRDDGSLRIITLDIFGDELVKDWEWNLIET